MSWEDRFSTMVKESSAKIDDAKRRLRSFDNVRAATLKNNVSSALSPPAFQSTPQSRDKLDNPFASSCLARNGLDDSLFTSHGSSSVALLHSLYEKIERQSQGFDLLKSKVETLETELNNQQREMKQFEEHLSILAQKVESFKPEIYGTTLDEFKTEIRCELNKIRDCIPYTKDEENTRERLLDNHTEENVRETLNSLGEIKSRLDHNTQIDNQTNYESSTEGNLLKAKIESDLSSSHHNMENNSKMVEKNITLLSDWKNENMESMNRLYKLQDLSVDEVKHLRSKLYNVQDRIDELETSINNVLFHNKLSSTRKSNSFLDEDDINSKVKHSNISISSDEEPSLTNSSDSFNASINGDFSPEIDDFNLENLDNESVVTKSQRSHSDLLNSSLNSHSGSEDSFSEI